MGDSKRRAFTLTSTGRSEQIVQPRGAVPISAIKCVIEDSSGAGSGGGGGVSGVELDLDPLLVELLKKIASTTDD